ncbi:MAG: hypothetical protein ABSD73_12390, partial [Candidatus Bathyarchaeia archaeon]
GTTRRKKEGTMPRKGSKHPYKPRKEYTYTLKDIVELAGTTRNALNVAKVRGKIDPGDFRSVVSFLTRIIIEKRLRGDLFTPSSRTGSRVKEGKSRANISRKRIKKTVRRK